MYLFGYGPFRFLKGVELNRSGVIFSTVCVGVGYKGAPHATPTARRHRRPCLS